MWGYTGICKGLLELGFFSFGKLIVSCGKRAPVTENQMDNGKQDGN